MSISYKVEGSKKLFRKITDDLATRISTLKQIGDNVNATFSLVNICSNINVIF